MVEPEIPSSLLPNRAVPAIDWDDMRSWNSVGWYVAFLVGVWGALMGVEEYVLADMFFGAAIVMFCVKWGHATYITRPERRTVPFIFGIVVAIILMGSSVLWTRAKSDESERKNKLLSQLSDLPDLKRQVGQIPALQFKIDALTSQNSDANSKISDKEDTIEKLSRAMATQMGKTEANLSSNINQYRTDTSSAVARLIQPDRHLTDIQKIKIHAAFMSNYCLLPSQDQNHTLIGVVWEPNGESAEYANEFVVAFTDSGKCGFYRSELRAAGPQIKGLTLITADWSNPPKVAVAIRDVLSANNVPFTAENGTLNGETFTLVVGSK